MSHIVVHPRILMVDNDKRAIEALTALLSKALPNAYVADDVTDGTKALSLCRAYGNQYDIILLDMSLEGLQEHAHSGHDQFQPQPIPKQCHRIWSARTC